MSYRLSWSLVSVGSASVGLLAAGIMMYAAGCGQSGETLHSAQGLCMLEFDDKNPCTIDICPDDGMVQHTPSYDGTTCSLGKNSGTCEDGVCKLSCESMPSDCACETVDDCPPDKECLKWSCENTSCKSTPQPGTVIAAQTQGDCQDIVCTATGLGTERKNNDADKPKAAEACHIGTCENGMPSQGLQGAGMPCDRDGGQPGVCDSSGQCVLCLENTSNGCKTGELCYRTTAGVLQCTNCSNNTKDTDEAGVDCGGVCAQCKPGGMCKTCAQGQTCKVGSDCSNSKPCVDGVCCEDLCPLACSACAPGTGQCEDVPTGTMDVLCLNGRVCAKGAGCVFRVGWTCSLDALCMSNNCNMATMKCAPGATGAPCVDGTDCKSGMCKPDHTCQ
jgi:hypothetical protein